jgi:hypothetical protein
MKKTEILEKNIIATLTDIDEDCDFVVIDGIEHDSLNKAPNDIFSEENWTPETWMIKISKKSPFHKKISTFERNAWFRVKFELKIEIKKSNAIDSKDNLSHEVLFFTTQNDATDEQANEILSIKVTNASEIRRGKELQKARRFSKLVNYKKYKKSDIESIMNNAISGSNKNRNNYIIYDVGQANWTALIDTENCTSNGSKVLMFYDFGKPTIFNYRGLPSNGIDPLQNDISKAFVFLSHWDTDHWSGASTTAIYNRRGLSIDWDLRALSLKWIVPNQGRKSTGQKITPTSWRLALALHRNNNLVIWPTRVDIIYNSVGDFVIKCQPTVTELINNNNTGLAFFSKNILHAHSKYFILSPGDADYTSISIPVNIPINHMVATHHGAMIKDVNSIPAPADSQNSRIIFSVGSINQYGHPNQIMTQNYSNYGWYKQAFTLNRNIRGYGTVSFNSTQCYGCVHHDFKKGCPLLV